MAEELPNEKIVWVLSLRHQQFIFHTRSGITPELHDDMCNLIPTQLYILTRIKLLRL